MTTAILIVAVVVIVGSYTAWRAWQGRGDLTVSMTLRVWARFQLTVPWAWMSLAGHWWGPPVPAWWPDWTPWGLVWATCAVGGVSVALVEAELIGVQEDGGELPGMWRVWLGVIMGGYVAGAALWPLTGGA